MKNLIKYYYDIDIENFKKKNNIFIFDYEDKKYEMVECVNIDMTEILDLYNFLKFYKYPCDEIIYNKYNNIFTYYKNVPYILLKKNYFLIKSELNLEQTIKNNYQVFFKKEIKWKQLWKEKTDYCEEQLKLIKCKDSIINQSYCYYFSLSEIAINLLNYVDNKSINLFVSHKRITKIEDLYDPLNITIDSRVRDFAEYIKKKFFINEIEEEEVINNIKKNNFTKDEAILFLARLIYPTYFFDIYDKIQNDKILEKQLKIIIDKTVQYEGFLKNTYTYIKKIFKIPKIEFLEF